jgi:predicted aminopeptidase
MVMILVWMNDLLDTWIKAFRVPVGQFFVYQQLSAVTPVLQVLAVKNHDITLKASTWCFPIAGTRAP